MMSGDIAASVFSTAPYWMSAGTWHCRHPDSSNEASYIKVVGPQTSDEVHGLYRNRQMKGSNLVVGLASPSLPTGLSEIPAPFFRTLAYIFEQAKSGLTYTPVTEEDLIRGVPLDDWCPPLWIPTGAAAATATAAADTMLAAVTAAGDPQHLFPAPPPSLASSSPPSEPHEVLSIAEKLRDRLLLDNAVERLILSAPYWCYLYSHDPSRAKKTPPKPAEQMLAMYHANCLPDWGPLLGLEEDVATFNSLPPCLFMTLGSLLQLIMSGAPYKPVGLAELNRWDKFIESRSASGTTQGAGTPGSTPPGQTQLSPQKQLVAAAAAAALPQQKHQSVSPISPTQMTPRSSLGGSGGSTFGFPRAASASLPGNMYGMHQAAAAAAAHMYAAHSPAGYSPAGMVWYSPGGGYPHHGHPMHPVAYGMHAVPSPLPHMMPAPPEMAATAFAAAALQPYERSSVISYGDRMTSVPSILQASVNERSSDTGPARPGSDRNFRTQLSSPARMNSRQVGVRQQSGPGPLFKMASSSYTAAQQQQQQLQQQQGTTSAQQPQQQQHSTSPPDIYRPGTTRWETPVFRLFTADATRGTNVAAWWYRSPTSPATGPIVGPLGCEQMILLYAHGSITNAHHACGVTADLPEDVLPHHTMFECIGELLHQVEHGGGEYHLYTAEEVISTTKSLSGIPEGVPLDASSGRFQQQRGEQVAAVQPSAVSQHASVEGSRGSDRSHHASHRSSYSGR